MRTVNSVTLLGNIAKAPVIRETPNGKQFATFVIATHREWVGEEGGRQTTPEFHNIVAWGNLSDIAESFCTKGRLVYVEGYLKTRTWENPGSGDRVFRTEIVSTNIIALSRPRNLDEDHMIEEEDDFFSASEDDFEGSIDSPEYKS